MLGLVIEHLIRKTDEICAAYHAAAVFVWPARRRSLVCIASMTGRALPEALFALLSICNC